MPLTIRPFTDHDWPIICQIHDLARPDELAGSCDPRAFVPIEEDPEMEELRSSQKLIAEKSGEVVGFVGVIEDYLAWLYVHPRYYGQGIGRKLLRSGLTLINGKAWTITLAGNTRALNLYQSEGFRELNRYESENAGYPCICLRLETES
jgi:ribosomal protein S18 acetylase RimI-like enzyme